MHEQKLLLTLDQTEYDDEIYRDENLFTVLKYHSLYLIYFFYGWTTASSIC